MQEKKYSAIDIMDISLNMLKASGPFADDESERYSESEIDRKKIIRAWQQLEIDGFVYTSTTEELGKKSIRFYITLYGVIALESCPFPYRLRPYRWKVVKANLSLFWKVISIVAVIINAIIVLMFTYLSYIKPA